ncbi:hypothetical protein HNP52_003722 [Sphingomonas kyeonggiensis]|uniref:Uncharacterized protein n=1 Tax=Sphingomonas kyeonggiensis TaxID=1268553 RepID=A0A7W7K566_9SPHN|nr:hypothetical protein [Sphingomonas kyeonggiensis]MBB4840630.1 hypothetical protein [Sphingomonas kyeonggiensis]
MATTRKPSSNPTPAKRTPAKRSSTTAAKKPAARKAKAPAAKAPAQASAPRSAHTAGIAAIGALAVTVLGAAAFGAWRILRRPSEGIVPTDLLGDTHPDGSERAIDAFRPDPTAPVPASEREQFRPALATAGMDVNS